MYAARAVRYGSSPGIVPFPRSPCPRVDCQRPQHRSRICAAAVADASTIHGLPEFLQNLKYDENGLVAVIVQVIPCHCVGMMCSLMEMVAQLCWYQMVACFTAAAGPSQRRSRVAFIVSFNVMSMQNVDSGDLAMQAFADQAALAETLQTGLATFYSRSRKGRWCKGETSGNFINVRAS